MSFFGYDEIKIYVNDSHIWISPGIPVSSTNKNDHHVIAEILLKVAINTIKPNH
jgi:hypothetical protein